MGADSGFAPAARMIFRQRSVSSFMIAVIPAGVLPIGSADNASRRFATSGSLSISAIAAESLTAMATGVLGGAETLDHPVDNDPRPEPPSPRPSRNPGPP